MIHAQVFPDYSVKQAMREFDIDRDDDTILSAIQSDLTCRCLVFVLRGAMVSCTLHKRKYINDKDIEYALMTAPFPRSNKSSREIGYLLDTRYFGPMCTSIIDILTEMMFKHELDCPGMKISAEVLISVQEATECLVRGFFEVFAVHTQKRQCTYRLFDAFLLQLLGEPAEDTPFVKP